MPISLVVHIVPSIFEIFLGALMLHSDAGVLMLLEYRRTFL